MQQTQVDNPFDYTLVMTPDELRKFRALTRNLENVSKATGRMIDEFESRRRRREKTKTPS